MLSINRGVENLVILLPSPTEKRTVATFQDMPHNLPQPETPQHCQLQPHKHRVPPINEHPQPIETAPPPQPNNQPKTAAQDQPSQPPLHRSQGKPLQLGRGETPSTGGLLKIQIKEGLRAVFDRNGWE